MDMKKIRGFTLIELLVVIAIIGILSTIVLVNVSVVRNKAKDAAVKLQLKQFMTIGLQYNLDNNNYNGLEASSEAQKIFADIRRITGWSGGGPWNIPGALNNNGNDKFCYVILLLTTYPPADYSYWCIDSTGFAGRFDSPNFSNCTSTYSCN